MTLKQKTATLDAIYAAHGLAFRNEAGIVVLRHLEAAYQELAMVIPAEAQVEAAKQLQLVPSPPVVKRKTGRPKGAVKKGGK